MRQGQQNRRGRGRGNNTNNSNNNNRKGQNPLSRTYESSGPDVKIRGTASQIAEKYTTLARDASSSGDTIMAENYLQHAEHYQRIIMAAQAQNVQPVMHNGSDASHAMNGAQRRDVNGAGREQPRLGNEEQPSTDSQPEVNAVEDNAEQPTVKQDAAPAEEKDGTEAAPAPKPTKSSKAAAAKESAKDADGEEPDGGRRRRRRYTSTNGSGRGASAGTAADGESPNGKTASSAASEEHPSDEATA